MEGVAGVAYEPDGSEAESPHATVEFFDQIVSLGVVGGDLVAEGKLFSERIGVL